MRVTWRWAPALALLALTGCSAEGAVGDGSRSDDLFVQGRVLRAGSPVPGAEVALLIEDVGAAGRSAAYDVPAAATDEDGRYAFEVDPAELPDRFLVDGEYVTFEVTVTEGGDTSAWPSTVSLLDDAAGWQVQGGGSDATVPSITFDLGHGTVEVTGSSGESVTYGE